MGYDSKNERIFAFPSNLDFLSTLKPQRIGRVSQLATYSYLDDIPKSISSFVEEGMDTKSKKKSICVPGRPRTMLKPERARVKGAKNRFTLIVMSGTRRHAKSVWSIIHSHARYAILISPRSSARSAMTSSTCTTSSNYLN